MVNGMAQGMWPTQPAPGAWAIESCTFTWLFDLGRQRFRRLPRGASVTVSAPPEAWVAYHQLDLEADAGCFTIALNPEGTRILRSWLHVEPCRHCGSQPPEEASMAELVDLVERWREEIRAVASGERRGYGSTGWAKTGPRRSRHGDDARGGGSR